MTSEWLTAFLRFPDAKRSGRLELSAMIKSPRPSFCAERLKVLNFDVGPGIHCLSEFFISAIRVIRG